MATVYARLSKDRSGLSENVGIQEREGRAHAASEGWPVEDVFHDNDISASKYSTKPRPGYEALLEQVKAGKIETIIVTEMTRLYRRMEELLVLIKLAETTKLKKIAVTDGTGYNLSTGEGIFNAVSAVNTAMLESRKISDRLKRKKKATAEAGKFHGGGRPYGYEADGVTIKEPEAEVIREVARRLIGGEGMSDIVRDLNARNVPTANGFQWRLANIWRVVHNKRLIGIREHNGLEYPAVWMPIYSVETYRLIEAQLKSRRRSHYGVTRGARRYVLTGFTYCGNCGGLMYGNAAGSDKGRVRRYVCKQYDNSMNKVGCGKVFRSADPLETFIKDAIFYRLQTTQLAELLNADERPDVAPLVADYETRKSKLDELVDDYASGLLNRQQFAAAKSVAENALEETRQELARVQAQLTGLSLPPGQTLEQAWEVRGIQWRNSFVKLLIEKVVVNPGHPGSHLYKTWRFNPDDIQVVWKV